MEPNRAIENAIRIAEHNCDRGLRYVLYSSVIFGAVDVVLLSYWDLSGTLALSLVAIGGVVGFMIQELSKAERAKCPFCGSSWEMRFFSETGAPCTKFEWKQCRYCGVEIPRL
jgi:hypothetical protein